MPGREELQGRRQLALARRPAEGQFVGAADAVRGGRPSFRGRASGQVAGTPAHERVVQQARFWVGTVVVFRRPQVAVESGASNVSANGLTTDRLMKA